MSQPQVATKGHVLVHATGHVWESWPRPSPAVALRGAVPYPTWTAE